MPGAPDLYVCIVKYDRLAIPKSNVRKKPEWMNEWNPEIQRPKQNHLSEVLEKTKKIQRKTRVLIDQTY